MTKYDFKYLNHVIRPSNKDNTIKILSEILEQKKLTSCIDFDASKKAICRLYELNEMTPPTRFYHAKSPLEAKIVSYSLNKHNHNQNLWKKFWKDFYDEIDFGGKKWVEAGEKLYYDILCLGIELDDFNFPINSFDICCNEHDYENICSKTFVKLKNEFNAKPTFITAYFQHLVMSITRGFVAEWFNSYWNYDWVIIECARRIGAPFTKVDSAKLETINQISQHCGASYLYDDFAIICDRPSMIHINNGMLHCENGMAFSFSDGCGVYALNNINVPEYVVLAPEKITYAKILDEQNAEVRRIMIERIGPERFVAISNAQVVHQDIDAIGNMRRLIKIPIGQEDWYGIKVTDSSKTQNANGEWVNKIYVLSVNPDHYGGRAGRECHAAIASTWRHGYDNTKLFFEKPEDYFLTVET